MEKLIVTPISPLIFLSASDLFYKHLDCGRLLFLNHLKIVQDYNPPRIRQIFARVESESDDSCASTWMGMFYSTVKIEEIQFLHNCELNFRICCRRLYLLFQLKFR